VVENEDLTAVVVYKGKATDAELLKAVSSELGGGDSEGEKTEEDEEHWTDPDLGQSPKKQKR
jgi:hypothetical protein